MSLQLKLGQPQYPSLLREIKDPPPVLWVEGEVGVLSREICVAIVGARECTPYGEKVAFNLAVELVRTGIVVVSGLAYGIDTAAHRGALEGAGKTVAVLGCGIDVPYPGGNLGLKKRIAQSGAVLSEFPPGTAAATWTFPQRNRIISGLARGVVVVEAGVKSGALITAEWALQQGREVFAVPGNITSPLSAGTNRLIGQGAKVVTGVSDILEELNIRSGLQAKENCRPLSTGEGAVLEFLSNGARNIDELVRLSGYPVGEVSSILTGLEIGGLVKSLPGSRFERL